MSATDPSATDPLAMFITNPNANTVDEDTSAVVYLISTRDDDTNELDVIITNNYGAPVTFSPDSPLTVSMKDVLPPDVIDQMQVRGIPDGWKWSVHKGRGGTQGIDLTPTRSVSLGDQQSLTFIFVNIVFTQAEVQAGGTTLGDFVASYSITVPDSKDPVTGDVTRKVLVTQLVKQNRLLTHFEAVVIEVPQEPYQWNVQIEDEQMYLGKDVKDVNAVYANAISKTPIRTRLAFRLKNQDMQFPLTLGSQSAFKVQFLPGGGCNQLANSQDLRNNITISEISTSDWLISPPSADGPLEWTLTPRSSAVFAKQVGSYDFLIDAVLPNGNPSNPKAGPADTEMYILYTNVPLRNDASRSYDDGYLAVDLEKIAPDHDMALIGASFKYAGTSKGKLSSGQELTISPLSFTLHVDHQVTLKGSVTVEGLAIPPSRDWSATGTWTYSADDNRKLVLKLSDQKYVVWRSSRAQDPDNHFQLTFSGAITMEFRGDTGGPGPSTFTQTSDSSVYCDYSYYAYSSPSKVGDCYTNLGSRIPFWPDDVIWNKTQQ